MIDVPTASALHYSRCIAACETCIATCDASMALFAGSPPPASLARATELCRSASGVCRMAIGDLVSGAKQHGQTVARAAVVCAACADACANHRHRPWEDCAEACRRATVELQLVASRLDLET